MNDVLAEARYLDRADYMPLPLAPRSKHPIAKDWPTRQFGRNDFKADSNIGVILGKRSEGLVCVDLDDPIAHQLADRFLPATGAKIGRPSSPSSHWFYEI